MLHDSCDATGVIGVTEVTGATDGIGGTASSSSAARQDDYDDTVMTLMVTGDDTAAMQIDHARHADGAVLEALGHCLPTSSTGPAADEVHVPVLDSAFSVGA